MESTGLEVTSWQAIVIDVFVMAMLLLWALLKAKRGLYNSFMPLVVLVLAVGFGVVMSQVLTPIAHNLFYEKVETAAVEKFDSSVNIAINGATTPARQFQQNWNALLESVGIDAKPLKEQVTEPEAVAAARDALKAKTDKSFTVFVKWVLFGACTAIALLLLTMLKNIVGNVSDWPVIRWFDWLGGFAIGAIEGLLAVFVVVKLFGLFGSEFFAEKAAGTFFLQMFI